MEENKCFALSVTGKCKVLKVGQCKAPERCKFYKTWEQIRGEDERLRGRRRELAE